MALWRCDPCGWCYDSDVGHPAGGIPPGAAFEDLPDSWVCPECGAEKDLFTRID